jgi:hypothetical protein
VPTEILADSIFINWKCFFDFGNSHEGRVSAACLKLLIAVYSIIPFYGLLLAGSCDA